MHGKTSLVYVKENSPLFVGLGSSFEVARYHSLIIEAGSVPSCLKVTSTTSQDEIMSLEHSEFPIYGIQFHPESILTEVGKKLLNNF